MGLAEKTLALLGTASTAWMLIQLHSIGAIHFYTLPTSSSNNSGGQGFASNTEAAEGGTFITTVHAQHKALGSVHLKGLHASMAVAVVLSWAGGLAQINISASLKITCANVTFALGRPYTM